MTDCECPCAWVDAKNYTEDELKMAVKKIQEKLLVSKDALSQQVTLQQHFNEVYGVFLPKLQTSVSFFYHTQGPDHACFEWHHPQSILNV